MQLRKKGYSDIEIQRRLQKKGIDISKNTISGWIYRNIKPLGIKLTN